MNTENWKVNWKYRLSENFSDWSQYGCYTIHIWFKTIFWEYMEANYRESDIVWRNGNKRNNKDKPVNKILRIQKLWMSFFIVYLGRKLFSSKHIIWEHSRKRLWNGHVTLDRMTKNILNIPFVNILSWEGKVVSVLDPKNNFKWLLLFMNNTWIHLMRI